MKQKDILFLLIPALILCLAWIGFSIYHNSVKSTIPETLNIQILLISPDFDHKTIEKIKNRKTVLPEMQFIQAPTQSPTQPPSQTPPVNPSLTPSPTATQTATPAPRSGVLP